jgi:hypothetical protein
MYETERSVPMREGAKNLPTDEYLVLKARSDKKRNVIGTADNRSTKSLVSLPANTAK